MHSSITAYFHHTEPIAENTESVTFLMPDSFTFKPGQYVSITLKQLEHLEVREQFRDFSISSPPKLLPLMTVSFRMSDSIFKKTLIALTPGDSLQIEGPAGVFTLSDTLSTPQLVAGGIGVTPFHSMALETSSPLTIYTYNRTGASAPYINELTNLPHVDLKPYLRKPKLADFMNAPKESNWYIAGPPGFVAKVRQILQTLDINDAYIKTEEFSGYEAHH